MTVKLIRGLSEDEYHADPCDRPSLSASIAHTLVSKSPAHAWLQHPRLGGKTRKPTKAMDTGTIIDRLILGGDLSEIEVIDAADYKKKATQELKAAAYDAGRTPVLAREFDELKVAADAIVKRLAEKGIVLTGESQVSMLWEETARDGTVVQCRGRMDHLIIADAHILDLKKVRSAHPDKAAAHIYEYGLDVQAAAYTSGLGKCVPELEGRVEFTDLFAEVEEPYPATVIRHAGTMRELGERRWQKAVNMWARCINENRWPDYSDTPVYVDARPWHLDEAASF